MLGRKHRWRSEASPAPARRRPLRTELSDECFAILEGCRGDSALADTAARWERTWSAWGPCLPGLDPRLAGLLLHTGWTVSTMVGDHRRAAGHMEAYFAHPGTQRDEPVVRAENRCRLARSHAALGEAEQAVTVWRLSLEDGSRATARMRLLCVRDTMLAALAEMPGETPCDQATASLASDVAVRLRRKRLARTLLAADPTVSDVVAALRATAETRRPAGG